MIGKEVGADWTGLGKQLDFTDEELQETQERRSVFVFHGFAFVGTFLLSCSVILRLFMIPLVSPYDQIVMKLKSTPFLDGYI